MSLGRHHDVIWYISYCNQLGNNVLSNLQVSRQWRQYFRIYRRGVGAFEATPPPPHPPGPRTPKKPRRNRVNETERELLAWLL